MIEYKCSKCGKEDVKLWRQYNTFLNHINLFCVKHALEDQNKEGIVDENGMYFDGELKMKSDTIGFLAPAVPTKEMDTFWGYSSVPQDLVDWWKELPLS